MNKNIFEIVEEVLKTNSKYLSDDGKLLKAVVYSDVMVMDKKLLSLLLAKEEIRERFFQEITGTLVFDKQKFAWFIASKEFLPDSYTRYTNKIGLTHDGDFISKSNDVVLDFPYKDCVLEGGQDKEEQKRKEILYNETIASDEISKMLAPKVFTNAKRYTKNGIEKNITFDDNDNLIIKGNNLIALSSLLKRYEGKVKCIYIDPPYNTGSDSFGYNDSFNHATWLLKDKKIRLESIKGNGGKGNSQNNCSNEEYRLDLRNEKWYVFNDNYGTSEEKLFVKYFKTHIEPKLKEKNLEYYVVRNERIPELAIYSFEAGERFEPDFLLFVRKKRSEGSLTYQGYVEPKGNQLLDSDAWKEVFLMQIEEDHSVTGLFANDYKIIGFPFFNSDHKMEEFEKAINTWMETV